VLVAFGDRKLSEMAFLHEPIAALFTPERLSASHRIGLPLDALDIKDQDGGEHDTKEALRSLFSNGAQIYSLVASEKQIPVAVACDSGPSVTLKFGAIKYKSATVADLIRQLNPTGVVDLLWASDDSEIDVRSNSTELLTAVSPAP